MPQFQQDSVGPPSETVTVREVLSVIESQRRLILGVVGVFLLGSAILAILEKREFRAHAVVRLIDNRPVLVGSREAPDVLVSRSTDPLLSRLEVLRSRTLVGRVVDSLGLRLTRISDDAIETEVSGLHVDESVDSDTISISFLPDRLVARGKAGVDTVAYGDTARLAGIRFVVAERPEISELTAAVLPRELAIDRVIENLQISRRENTDVVDVAYVNSNPYLAQSVVNAMVVKFEEQGVASAREQSRIRREFLEEQLSQTEAILRTSQSELASYRSSENLAGSRQRIAAEQTELLSIETRLQELRADRQLVAALEEDLRRGDAETRAAAVRVASSLPQLVEQPSVIGNYRQIMDYQARLDSLTTGPLRVAQTNPDVVQLRTLIRSTEDRIGESLTAFVAAADARIAALESIRDRTAASVRSLPGKEAVETRLGRQVEVTTAMADELRLAYQEARIAENSQIGDVVIVDMAPLPYEPAVGLWPVKLLLGLLLGLALGIVVAFLREAKNTTVRSPQELGEVLQLPQLAIIPKTPELRVYGEREPAGFLPRLVSRSTGTPDDEDPQIDRLGAEDTVSREAFRVLRTSVLSSLGSDERRPKSVAITSVGPGEGKTMTAVNLAVSFAHKAMSIVLVDCDVRRPCVHKVLDLPRAPGLADLLNPQSSYFLRFRNVVKRTPLENLSIIPCGTALRHPSDLFEGAPIRRLLADLSSAYDVVILDTPPVLAAADASILGQLVDGAVLVIRAGQTERASAQRAYAQLTLAKVRVFGAIFNDPDGRSARYGPRYDRYWSSYAVESVDA